MERLRNIGFPDNAVSVESISADVTQGPLTKSSAATYQLRVRCNDVALVATLLSELPNLKNADLRGIEWRYPRFEDARVQWLRESVQVANRKAAALAEGLNVTLAGIHRCSEKVTEEERESRAYLSDFVAVGSGHGKTDQSRRALVLPLRQTKKVKLRIVVEYRIGGDGPAENVADSGHGGPAGIRRPFDGL